MECIWGEPVKHRLVLATINLCIKSEVSGFTLDSGRMGASAVNNWADYAYAQLQCQYLIAHMRLPINLS